MLHLWVDPKFGDDTQAAIQNPAPSGALPCCPWETAPNGVQNPSLGHATLLHASWPFRTVTGAVNYIYAVTQQQPPLPYSHPYTGGTCASGNDQDDAPTWEYAIIHCLPGIYARWSGTHSDNGLKGNGESFPIHLPPRVSVQGTSALNTVFDLVAFPDGEGGGSGPAFEFGVMAGSTPITGEGTFIDSVTIMGATAVQTIQTAHQLAAITVNNVLEAAPTISNCFLVRNYVGVLVAGSWNLPDTHLPGTVVHAGVKLFNNTIAFNRIGVWNGLLPRLPGPPYNDPVATGFSRLILVNNIIDGGEPNAVNGAWCRYPSHWQFGGWFGNGASGMQGMAGEDLRITSPLTPPPGDYNAYELQRYNFPNAPIIAPLPATQPRSGTTAPAPQANLNIAPYTGYIHQSPPIRRGVLYVRDLICNCRAAGALGTPGTLAEFDDSPHDFRLAPAATLASDDPIYDPGGAGGLLNRLVDSGWDGSFPLTMANGLVVNYPPGYLPLGTSQNTWAFDHWTLGFDAEGFGNRRIEDHPIYSGPNHGREIDVGADELGDSIIAGMRFATTSFLRYPVEEPIQRRPVMRNEFYWFLGPPKTKVGSSVPYPPRPLHRGVSHLGNPPTPIPTAYNYSVPSGRLPPWFDAWGFDDAARSYYNPYLVEIMPHLLPDGHPWWHQQLGATWPSNPVWQYCYPSIYNGLLYFDPTQPVVHPPGADVGLPNQFIWLDATYGTPSFTVFDQHGQQAAFPIIAEFDGWSRGTIPSPTPPTYDWFPATSPSVDTLQALRYSVEKKDRGFWTPDLSRNNLQSFLVMVVE